MVNQPALSNVYNSIQEKMTGSRAEQPVFIVGAPRSGTTLLAAMLASHSRMSCGPETDFFYALRHTDVRRLTNLDCWPGPAVQFLASIRNWEGVRIIDNFGISEEDITTYLEGKPPSIASLLAALCEQHMVRAGKSRWVEKTPRHIDEVRIMRRYFPRAPIIRIVRDPRDVALSVTRMPWGSKSFLNVVVRWKRRDILSATFCARDPRSYSIRYEDLVLSPKTVLRHLCGFLGESYEPRMLEMWRGARQVVGSHNEAYHPRIGRELDASRVAVWESSLTASENLTVESLLGDRLQAYGYPVRNTFSTYLPVYPEGRLINYPEVLRRMERERIRCWPLNARERPDGVIFLGQPAFGKTRRKRVFNTVRIAGLLLRLRLQRKPIYWERDTVKKGGYCNRLLTMLLEGYPTVQSCPRLAPAGESEESYATRLT
jgi:hypothetical protein